MQNKTKILIAGGAIAMAGVLYKLPSILFKNFNEYDEYIFRVCRREGLPESLVKAIIAVESGFNPNAKASTSSATGLMQMTKGACEDVGVSHYLMTEPIHAINAGCTYLAKMVKATGTLHAGVRAYYEGLGNYKKNTDLDPNNNNNERHAESLAYLYKVLAYQLAIWGGR